MTIVTRLIVFPEGDIQEIPHTLRIDQLVDLNGYPLALPLPTSKVIAYRVQRISTNESTGEETTYYHLELLRRDELTGYT